MSFIIKKTWRHVWNYNLKGTWLTWVTWQRKKPWAGKCGMNYLFMKNLQHNHRGVTKYPSGFACLFPDPNVNMRWLKANNEQIMNQKQNQQKIIKRSWHLRMMLKVAQRHQIWTVNRADEGQTQRKWCRVNPELIPQNVNEHQLEPK